MWRSDEQTGLINQFVRIELTVGSIHSTAVALCSAKLVMMIIIQLAMR